VHLASGDDVGCDLVFDEGDAVAQLQLALFQPLNLQYVGSRRVLQGFDRDVQITMLLLQARQRGPQLPFFLFGHRRNALGAAGALAAERQSMRISRFLRCRFKSSYPKDGWALLMSRGFVAAHNEWPVDDGQGPCHTPRVRLAI
jgi:hypothetical protein